MLLLLPLHLLTTLLQLLLLEMLFNGLFNDMTPQLIAALLSTFVFDSERKKEKARAPTPSAVRVCVAHRPRQEGDPSAVPPQLMKEIGPFLRTMQVTRALGRRGVGAARLCSLQRAQSLARRVATVCPGLRLV